MTSAIGRNRVLVLVLVMASGLFLVTGTTIWLLYRAALESIGARLVETAQSQARLFEAIASEEAAHEGRSDRQIDEVVLGQIIDAHHRYKSFAETSEFTLARRDGDLIVYLLGHRHARVELPDPVPIRSADAEPMRRALRGESGTVVGLDYSGATVLAAHEPVAGLGLGIVAKIDLWEVRAPFVNAGLFAFGFSLLVAAAGAALVVRITRPLITELEESVAALSDSEERFRTTFELAGAGIARVALDGRFSEVNDRVCEMTGYTRDEIVKLSFREITHPDDIETDLEYARQLLDGEIERYSMDKRYLRKDSSLIWVRLTGSIVRDGEGRPKYFIAVIEDITSQRAAELAVKNSLREKEVLLQEIHHRVKNNLQVVSSLLSLQSTRIEDPRLRRVFKESQSRVRAMALIHEILYDSKDLAGIRLGAYVERIVDGLMRTYGADPDRVRLVVEAEDLRLGIDEMVPCGLAINELISNSLKYAFPDGREGRITIRVSQDENGGIVLVVRDDGVGLPDDLDLRSSRGMGMGLVLGLVEKQLGGRLEVDRSHGACFTIVIPPKDTGSRPATTTLNE